MIKVLRKQSNVIAMLLVSVSILVLLPVACTASQGEETQVPSAIELARIAGRYPKLDSALNLLLYYESKGEAASYAKAHDIALVDGRVRTTIEAMPGKAEAAAKAATNAGAKVEATADNYVQALVPVSRLISLAGSRSIRRIGTPGRPAPA